MKKLMLTTVALLSGSTLPVFADLVVADDSRHGLGSITIDTQTGLEWLDVPLTLGLSYNQVLSQMAPGGRWEGFRYAKASEVRGLFQNVGIVDIDTFEDSTANVEPARRLVALVGATDPGHIYPQVFGLATPDNPSRTVLQSFVNFYYLNGVQIVCDARVSLYDGVSRDFSAFYAGSWLVRPVPEPGVISLVFLGLGALATVRLAARKIKGHGTKV